MRNTVLDACGIIRVQSWNVETVAPPMLESMLAVSLPRATGTIARGRADILCIGPGDWLVIALDSEFAGFQESLGKALQGTAFNATDVSQALSRIEVEGPEIRDLLAKGCSLDFHPPLFPPGRALRTRFAGIPVIVRCTGTATFELIVTRSFLDYLIAWLADAELEFETPI
jgi:sarcosine oxidase subunit gamma